MRCGSRAPNPATIELQELHIGHFTRRHDELAVLAASDMPADATLKGSSVKIRRAKSVCIRRQTTSGLLESPQMSR